MRWRPLFLALPLLLAGGLLAGCSDDENNDADFQLQLLHYADVDGGGTAALENVEAFSALVDHFRGGMPEHTVLVSSGDNYIPGPIFQASDDERVGAVTGAAGVGRGEIAMANALGVQVSAVGNHELDAGTETFAGIISADGDYPGAQFPYLSGNLDFSSDLHLADLVTTDADAAEDGAGRLAASAVVTVDGERVGFVGASTPTLASITSTGDIGITPEGFDGSEEALDALAQVIQEDVDVLLDMGIDKIILLAHMQQIQVEQALAPRLCGVDVIVAGGSNTLLADGDDILRAGDTAADFYPLEYTAACDEAPVLVVNTDGDFTYLGRLMLEFDDQGRIITDALDPAMNGAWAATEDTVNRLGAEPIPGVMAVSDALRDVLVEKDGNVQGHTDVYLDGRRTTVRSRESNLGDLTADANLWYAGQLDEVEDPVISLKNGGGIRADIGRINAPPGSTDASEVQYLPPAGNDYGKPEGGVSQLDIETSLAFNNGLVTLTVTAAELWDILEHAVAAAGPDATPGSFPQVAGVRFEFDTSRTARTGGDDNQGAATTGERIRTLKVVDDSGAVTDTVVENGALVGDAGRTFRLVTLNFLADCAVDGGDCGDGYPYKNLTAPDYRSLEEPAYTVNDPGLSDFAPAGTEQDALGEYLQAFHGDAGSAYDVPMDVNERILNVTP
ncbi:bifunctional metallophosphatase/5'-nucleotidase [Ectothiorhodospira mobilis]|uniref:bifunctional metallophosphatase/5'-nucleotidase n=1 Tax=Ectothiorhodospira mobilis TaxID=195064 RepID=UPI001EE897B3|nr:bifunctional metallophosphatase/5'-nucleotidase [Ectothiorhodospira mobilis]MCG5535887.1 bifunctional metallophosphatase/5'-nucleotidase [Ectothiorhodospira mobilis]